MLDSEEMEMTDMKTEKSLLDDMWSYVKKKYKLNMPF